VPPLRVVAGGGMGCKCAAACAWATKLLCGALLLLQVAAVAGVTANSLATPPVLKITPIYYVHVPKCGSSFGSVLLFTGCPKVPRWMWGDKRLRRPSEYFKYIKGHCAGAFARFKNGHDGLPHAAVSKYSGRIVTMLRQPEDRFVSAFLHNLHDCEPLKRRWLDNGKVWTESTLRKVLSNDSKASLLLCSYFKCVRGCATNMLAGKVCDAGRPSNGTTARALDVVRAHAGFVGLQEQYNTSVALWERMFGLPAPLPDVVYHNTRPNGMGAYKARVYELVHKLGLRDEADEALYNAALEWFDARRAAYLPDVTAVPL